MIIAITGVTGNMGQALFAELKNMQCFDKVSKIKLLCRSPKKMKKLLKKNAALESRTTLISGDMHDSNALAELVTGSDFVINLASVIPPKSDYSPEQTIKCNDLGVKLLVSEIEKLKSKQPMLIHISSVAIYGNRSGDHKFIRVGDPLIPAVYDPYSVTKLRGEWHVLESNISKWIILRQSAMLHSNLFADNIHGGLLFHTVLNCPIEWVTAHDSGVLIANIIDATYKKELEASFWRHCYNIVGGKLNRNYGMQSYDNGFSVLGGTTKDFFQPSDIITRNFHCGWFTDDILEEKFHYLSETVDQFWIDIFNAHPLFKLGRFVPKCLIRTFLFDRLKKDSIAPKYWARHGDIARLTAYYGSEEEYNKLTKTPWKEFKIPDISEIATLTENAVPVHYGYDIDKSDDALTQADLEAVAKAHGGKLIGKFNGDIYEKLEWQTQDKETFFANAHTVLRAGHWYNPLYTSFVWDFDRLAKKDKVFASVWYDSHRKDEDLTYSFDKNWVATLTKGV